MREDALGRSTARLGFGKGRARLASDYNFVALQTAEQCSVFKPLAVLHRVLCIVSAAQSHLSQVRFAGARNPGTIKARLKAN